MNYPVNNHMQHFIISAEDFFKAALGEVTSRELLAHPPHTRVMRLYIQIIYTGN